MVNVRVKNVRVLRFKHMREKRRGALIPIEALRDIPFEMKRIFFIRGVKDPDAARANHAHTRGRQVLVCVHGSCVVHVDDGERRQKFLLRDPAMGVFINPYVWVRLTNFSPDCVLGAITDEYFDRAEYLNDYDAFLARARKHLSSR